MVLDVAAHTMNTGASKLQKHGFYGLDFRHFTIWLSLCPRRFWSLTGMILVDAEPQATHVGVFRESGPQVKVIICKIYNSRGPCNILHGTLEDPRSRSWPLSRKCQTIGLNEYTGSVAASTSSNGAAPHGVHVGRSCCAWHQRSFDAKCRVGRC